MGRGESETTTLAEGEGKHAEGSESGSGSGKKVSALSLSLPPFQRIYCSDALSIVKKYPFEKLTDAVFAFVELGQPSFLSFLEERQDPSLHGTDMVPLASESHSPTPFFPFLPRNENEVLLSVQKQATR